MDLALLDTLLRGVAIGGFSATTLVLIYSGKQTRATWLGVAFYVCAIAHVLDNVLGLRDGTGLRGDVLWFAQNSATPLLWAFLLSVFDDSKSGFWPRLLPTLLLAGFTIINHFVFGGQWGAYYLIFHTASVGLMVHLLVTMARGIGGDLIETRRRMRAPLIVSAAAYVAFCAWADLDTKLCCSGMNNWHLAQSIMLAFMGLGTVIGFSNVGPMFWGTRNVIVPERATDEAATPVDGQDKALLSRLQKALDVDQIWKREGLSIGTLAHQLTIPEYRLRRLINEKLGYKNFADFINSHRIEAAKLILQDPANATMPISQIAFDMGYGSLGPFNRAFKSETSLSPSEWREKMLAVS